MPLMQLQTGQTAILREVHWGNRLQRKLYDMGMTPGTEIRMVNASGFGPVIVSVRGCRLALGRGVVQKISVDPV